MIRFRTRLLTLVLAAGAALVAVQPHAGFAFRHPRPVRPSDPPLLGVVVGLIEAVK